MVQKSHFIWAMVLTLLLLSTASAQGTNPAVPLDPETRCYHDTPCNYTAIPVPERVARQVNAFWDCPQVTRFETACDLTTIECDNAGFCTAHPVASVFKQVPERELPTLSIGTRWSCTEKHGFEICDIVLVVCDVDSNGKTMCFPSR